MDETKKTFKDWLDSPERIQMAEEFEKHRKQREMEIDYWWNNELSEADREKAFYAVCKRIHQSDVRDRGSYRWTLYDVFKFDMGMYGDGLDCGYMDIHNYIAIGIEFKEILKAPRVRINNLSHEVVASKTKDMKLDIKLNKDGEAVIFFGFEKDYLDEKF